jgi:hypothetical protein
MISRSWSFECVYQGQLTCLLVFLVSPDFVGSEIRRVEISFCGIEYHAVDSGFGTVFVVLDVLCQRAVRIDGEYVPVTCMVVEGVSVDVVGWLFGC